jgi:hypothetical protein
MLFLMCDAEPLSLSTCFASLMTIKQWEGRMQGGLRFEERDSDTWRFLSL